jgi:hypothetical protein
VKSCEEFVRELQDQRLLPRRIMTADSLIDPAPVIALRLREAWDAAAAAERERLGRPPAGQYRCGCPLVVCDNVKAFCPTHHKTIVPGGEPT